MLALQHARANSGFFVTSGLLCHQRSGKCLNMVRVRARDSTKQQRVVSFSSSTPPSSAKPPSWSPLSSWKKFKEAQSTKYPKVRSRVWGIYYSVITGLTLTRPPSLVYPHSQTQNKQERPPPPLRHYPLEGRPRRRPLRLHLPGRQDDRHIRVRQGPEVHGEEADETAVDELRVGEGEE